MSARAGYTLAVLVGSPAENSTLPVRFEHGFWDSEMEMDL